MCPENAEGMRLGDQAVSAWDAFAEAALLEDGATAQLEDELTR
jgi:hypothetical protein